MPVDIFNVLNIKTSKFSNILLISDIHGNIDELRKIIRKMKNGNYKNKTVIFLGDLIEKGKNSVETLLTVKDIVENPKKYNIKKAYMIIGNHELRFLKYAYKTCIKKNKDNIWYRKSKENNDMQLINYFSKPENHGKLFEVINFLKDSYSYITVNKKYFISHAYALPHLKNGKITSKHFYSERNINVPNNYPEMFNICGHLNRGIIRKDNVISIDGTFKKKVYCVSLKQIDQRIKKPEKPPKDNFVDGCLFMLKDNKTHKNIEKK